MSPVWVPAEKPPVLDKYCHLSLDAQRVMVALYSDFHQRRAQLASMQSQTPGLTDPKNYYQSIYEARFGSGKRQTNLAVESSIQHPSTVIKSSAIPSFYPTQIHKVNDSSMQNSSYSLQQTQTARKLLFPHVDEKSKNTCETSLPKHYAQTYISNIFPTQDIQDPLQSHNTSRPSVAVYLSQDTSNYSDSPPVETQDFRLLSQYRDEDTYDMMDESDSVTGDHASTRKFQTFIGAAPSIHSTVWSNNSTNIQKPRSSTFGDSTCCKDNEMGDRSIKLNQNMNKTYSDFDMYEKFEQSEKRQNLKESLGLHRSNIDCSPPLFSQDVKENKQTNNKFTDMTSEVQHSAMEQQKKRQDFVEGMDRGDNDSRNIEISSLKEQDGTEYNKENEFVFRPVIVPVEGQSSKNNGFTSGSVVDSVEALQKVRLDNTMTNCLETIAEGHTRKTVGKANEQDESPFPSVSETAPEKHANSRANFQSSNKPAKRLFAEEPLLGGQDEALKQRQSVADELCIVDTEQCRSNQSLDESLFVTKRAPLFPVFNKPSSTLSKESASFNQVSSKKRKHGVVSASAFKVPVKKSRFAIESETVTSKATASAVHLNICEETWETICELKREILASDTVVVSLVYADNLTKLRGNVFGQDNKKKTTSKGNPAFEVKGFALFPVKSGCKQGAFFPAFISNRKLLHWTKEFWQELLVCSSIQKVGFNVKDFYIELITCLQLDIDHVDTRWTVYDAGVAWWLLDPDKPAVSFEQLLRALALPAQGSSQCGMAALREDSALLTAAMDKLRQKLEHRGLWSLFTRLETPLTSVLAAMERRPLMVDTQSLRQVSDLLKRKLSQLEQQAHTAAGRGFLLTSHHQLRQVLFEELKLNLKLPGKTKLAKTNVGRETSTSEAVLTQLLPFHPLPAIVLEHRQLMKLKSTYIDGIMSCVSDGQLFTHWDQTAAATGRLTSHQPNIQAVPKLPVTINSFQTCFIPDKEGSTVTEVFARDPFISRVGYTFLAADFQQVELRLLGHLANDPVLIKLFNSTDDTDIFNALTAQWLGKPLDGITSQEREQTKRVVYSVMYGVGKEKLGEYLKIKPEDAKAIMTSFLLKFPAVNEFTNSCIEFCVKYGYTGTILGRRRLFPNIHHSNGSLRTQTERQCVNFCVQGSAADICKSAMLQVESTLADNRDVEARLLVQIHDELLLEVKDEHRDKVIDLVKRAMECREGICGGQATLQVPLPVAISVGKKWGHMDSVKLQK